MKKFISLLCLVLISLVLLSQQTEIDTKNEPGTLAGSFGVSLTGSATYSIPIELPPGIGGMTPELGFVYNSINGVGIMGKGWSIGGLSAVTRVPATTYLNDYPSPVNFSEDQLSIGGKKIIEVNQNNSEYRFEHDDMTKILKQRMKNSKMDGVKYVVYSKSGLVTTYGGSDNSHLTYNPVNNATLMYYLSKIEDQHGNSIEYLYDQNTSEGSLYLSKIEYTIHNDGLSAILEPEFEVNFIYDELENKDTKTVLFSTGAYSRDAFKYTMGKRLREVQIYHNKMMVSKYEISYLQVGERDQYLAERITLSRDDKSLNSTCFNWIYDIAVNTNSINVSETWDDLPENLPQQKLQTADYNGNGLDDIIVLNSTATQTFISLYINNNKGQSFELNDIEIVGKVKTANSIISRDFNGDGKNEIMVQTYAHGIFLYEIVKNSITDKYEFIRRPHPISVASVPDKQQLYSGDFNGDGLSDCITESNDGLLEYYGGSTTNFIEQSNIDIQLSNLDSDIYIGDFDGEGKSEVLLFDAEKEEGRIVELNTKNDEFLQHKINIYYPTSLGGNKLRPDFSNENIKLVLSDMNQDGKTDILVSDKDKNEISFFFSFGYDFEFQQTLYDIEHDNLSIADINGDGIQDLISYQKKLNYHSEGYLETYIINTDGLTLENPNALPIEGQSSPIFFLGHYKFANFSGTGKQDLVCSYIHSIYHEDWNQEVDVVFNGYKSVNRINKITDGFGKTIKIEYEFLPQTAKYHADELVTSPTLRISTPSWMVITKVEKDNGKGGFLNPITYEYHKLFYHRLGKAFLGFEKMIVKNGITNSYLLNYFKIYGADIDKYYLLYNAITDKYSLNGTERGQLIKRSINEIDHINGYDDHRIFFHYIKKNSYSEYDYLTGKNYKFNYTVKENFDEFRNCGKTTVTKYMLFSKTHQTTYEYKYKNFTDNGSWIIGQPEVTLITKKYLGQTTIPASIDYSIYNYYEDSNENGFGLLKTEVFQIDDPNALQKSYTYDKFGNIHEVSVDSYNNPSDETIRTTEFIYGTEYNHRFVTQKINPLKQTTNYSYNKTWGWEQLITDPNGLRIKKQYSLFGLLNSMKYTDGIATTHFIKWVADKADSPEYALYYVESQKDGNPSVQTYYDKLSRELRTVTIGFNGDKIYQDSDYNSDDGKLYSSSKPYYSNESKYLTKYKYDNIKRIKRIELPGSRFFNYVFLMNLESITNPLKQNTYVRKGSLGKPEYINENDVATTIRNYDAAGQLIETKLENQENTKISYKFDTFGNIIEINDPAIGKKEYKYNCFGELVKVFHNEIIEQENLEYDKLGRLTIMNEPEHGQTTYLFDEQFIGLPDEINFASSVNGSLFKTKFDYDDKARKIATTESILHNNINEQFVISQTYDEFSRTKSLTYPTGYTILHNYNKNGYLNKISQGIDNSTLWENKEMNASQQFTEYDYGNGITTFNKYIPTLGYLWTSDAINIENKSFVNSKLYKWDEIGNLSYYTEDSEFGDYRMESFEYDNLNRLDKTELHLNGHYVSKVELKYDNLGRIMCKKGDRPEFHVANKYSYNDNSPNPYKLLSIDGVPAFYNADLQEMKYTTFDKVENIRQFSLGHRLVGELDIIYANANQRKIQMNFDYENFKKRTKIYVGGIFEKIIIEDLAKSTYVQTEEIHYINAPTGLIAINTEKSGSKASGLKYVHKNNLGSITELTDTQSRIVERYSYDSWGRRRNPDSWFPWDEVTETVTDHGYSGHEQLDKFALINMNGRIYDPVVGLFTSPDPILGVPANSQAFNNYSYVYNNPLKFADPTGFRPEEIADIGAGPMWYHLFGSTMDFIGNILNSERFFSMDFSGNFQETKVLPVDGVGISNKKSPSARRLPQEDKRSSKSGNNNKYKQNLDRELRSTPIDNDGTEPLLETRKSRLPQSDDVNNEIAQLFSKYKAGYIADDNTADLFPNLEFNKNTMVSRYLIGGVGVWLLGTINSGAGTIGGGMIVTIHGQEMISKNNYDNYLQNGRGMGIYSINISAPGFFPRAMLFNAIDGSSIGWHNTIVKGAPTMQYYNYQKFLQELKNVRDE